MDDHKPTNFGNIPYLALPTLVLVVIIIIVGLASKYEDKDDVTPTVGLPTVESYPTTTPSGVCVITERTAEIVTIQCNSSIYQQFSD
jgi:hypothetical protein